MSTPECARRCVRMCTHSPWPNLLKVLRIDGISDPLLCFMLVRVSMPELYGKKYHLFGTLHRFE